MSFAVSPILILWTMMTMHGNDGDGIVSKGRRRDLQTTPICPRGQNLKWRPATKAQLVCADEDRDNGQV